MVRIAAGDWEFVEESVPDTHAESLRDLVLPIESAGRAV
jgi:hypothetical protein